MGRPAPLPRPGRRGFLLLEGGFFPDSRPRIADRPVAWLTWKGAVGAWELPPRWEAPPCPASPFAALEAFLQLGRARLPGGRAFTLLGYGLRHWVEDVPPAAAPSPEPDLVAALYPAERWRPVEGPDLPGGRPFRLGPVRLPDRERFLEGVRLLREHIAAGDCYQANLTHPFLAPFQGDPWGLFLALRSPLPARRGGYFDAGPFQIAGVSPESFLEWRDGLVTTRPIKGTRPRGASLAEDEALASELWHSAKERAELTMIVDLLRNDLGRVCRPGAVRVTDRCRLETFPTVHHLEGVVTGRLREGAGLADWLAPLLPGGSVTGAPKVRVMEILAGLEARERGLYTGAMGWIDFEGSGSLNIIIRTAVVRPGEVEYWAGSGITWDSDPVAEWEESVVKAAPLLREEKREERR